MFLVEMGMSQHVVKQSKNTELSLSRLWNQQASKIEPSRPEAGRAGCTLEKEESPRNPFLNEESELGRNGFRDCLGGFR